jgi:hypothetical protein
VSDETEGSVEYDPRAELLRAAQDPDLNILVIALQEVAQRVVDLEGNIEDIEARLERVL